MTNSFGTLSTKAFAAVLTLVFSAAMVVGAVGPAVDGSNVSQQVASALDNVTGESANSLA